MSWPRSATAGRLEDGRVLVLGGDRASARANAGAAKVVEWDGAWRELDGKFEIICYEAC